MPRILVTTLFASIQICVLSWRSPGQDVAPPAAPALQKPVLEAQAFQNAFEAAYDSEDRAGIARLVQANATQCVQQFETYTRVWIARSGAAGEREQRAMAKSRVLAAAMDDVHGLPGLLEVIEAIESWSDDDRKAWCGARAAIGQGKQLADNYRWREALEPLTRACATLDQLSDGIGLSDAATELGNCCIHLGQHEKAIEHHTRALELRETIGNGQEIANSIDNLGLCYFFLSEYEKAIEHHARALELKEQVGDPNLVAHSLNNLGNCYVSLGRYEEAITHHTRALALREQIGNANLIAHSLNNLGSCHYHLGQFEKATDYHTRALALRDKIGNPQNTSHSLANLGACYESLGQSETAIGYFTRALELREKIGNAQDIAYSLNNLGVCYESLGQYETAIEHFTRALDLHEKIGNAQDIAMSLNNLGMCHASLGRHEKAIGYIVRAQALQEKIGNPQDIAGSLSNLGVCRAAMGQPEMAIEHHKRALELRQQIGNARYVALSLNNLGACYSRLGRHQEAIEHFARSLELREKIGNPQDIAMSLNNLGAGYDSAGRHDDALRSLEACVAALDQVPRRSFDEDGRAAFTAKWSDVPPLVCRIVQGLKVEDALVRGFPLVEAFSSRTLLEHLQERAEGFLGSTNPELSHERKSLLNRMVELRFALGKEVSNGRPDSIEAERLRADVNRVQGAFKDVERKLRAQDPRLAELIVPRPASLAEAQAVIAPTEAMLVFVLGSEQSYVWAVTANSAALVALPPEPVIRATFDAFIAALAADASGGHDLDARFVSSARDLYRQLLAPVADRISAASDLILVPSGFLGLLPFEALLTKDMDQDAVRDVGKLPYLLHEKAVRYAPSASVLAWCRVEAQRREHRGWKKNLCLFGDAIYGEGQGASRARMSPEVGRLPRLMATRAEAISIAETQIGDHEDRIFRELRKLERSGHIAGERFDLYVGNEASRENLLRDLRGYRIVHLAVHGHFDEQFPWSSGIVLSGTSDAERLLNLVDIAGLKLDAEIVFLSACETARGRESGSDGIRSTARSFLLAGAASVVATQWPVRDDAAATVAQEFYRRLLEGLSPTEALREAKIALLQSKVGERGARAVAGGIDRDAALQRFAHPYFWAPFILCGR